MSKSDGNILDLAGVTALGVRPVELRYYLVAAHYRSRIDYSDEALREAAVAYRRLEGFVQRAAERVGAGSPGPVCAEFTAAMDDDLNTPRALAAVHEVLREGNTAYAEGDQGTLRGALAAIRGMLGVLGLDPLDPAWSGQGGADQLRGVVDGLVSLALEQREAARARKDWPAADAVRDRLKQAGVVVEDTPQGPRWTVGG
jgi:cysteinyl-tRNA synthetase